MHSFFLYLLWLIIVFISLCSGQICERHTFTGFFFSFAMGSVLLFYSKLLHMQNCISLVTEKSHIMLNNAETKNTSRNFQFKALILLFLLEISLIRKKKL